MVLGSGGSEEYSASRLLVVGPQTQDMGKARPDGASAGLAPAEALELSGGPIDSALPCRPTAGAIRAARVPSRLEGLDVP
jgi:hypothetical protein